MGSVQAMVPVRHRPVLRIAQVSRHPTTAADSGPRRSSARHGRLGRGRAIGPMQLPDDRAEEAVIASLARDIGVNEGGLAEHGPTMFAAVTGQAQSRSDHPYWS